jgi:type III pantothenate kinase
MVLVIDIGNTNVKLGVFSQSGELIHSTRLSSSTHKTSDEYYLNIRDLFQQKDIAISDIEGVILSSVNPNLNYTFEHLISTYFPVKLMIVGSGIKTGINVRYDNPKEVGADRIVNSVAAYKTYGGPCIVIDCGTATSFNVINSQGEFLGGAISFGLKSSAEALGNSAAKLPNVEFVKPDNVINKSTITNMQAGILYGYCGMVDYIVNKMKKEINEKVTVVATGGLSEIVANESDVIDVVDKTLTLRGLNVLYKLNSDKK